MKILVINGVNLGSLGKRSVEHYGVMTLEQLNSMVRAYIIAKGAKAEFFHSNYEGAIVDRIEKVDYDGLVINAGAYSHYSYAIADALESVDVPKVEAHLSDIMAREAFRRKRIFENVVDGAFWGEKEKSYYKAIDAICVLYTENKK
ncbi:MAG: type II 3-dehydroquinate dehydratase [Clostridia bacterium]